MMVNSVDRIAPKAKTGSMLLSTLHKEGYRWGAALVLAALLVLFGCSRQSPPTGSSPIADTLQNIQSRKEMRVGYLVWDPCIVRDSSTGQLSGIYVEMVDQMARATGWKVTWVETSLANFSAGLASRQFDFCVGPTFVTIPRAAAVAFTEPVAFVGNSAVIKRSAQNKPGKIADLNRPSCTIAVLQGQALDEFCRKNLPNAQLVVLGGTDLTAPLAAVAAGQADVGFMNSVTVKKFLAANPELEEIFGGADQVEVLPLSWATRTEDRSLLGFLNASITYLQSTGRIDDYQRKYQTRLLYDRFQLR